MFLIFATDGETRHLGLSSNFILFTNCETMKNLRMAIIGTTLCALAALSSSCQKIEEPDTDTGLHLDIDYGDSIKTNAVITFSCAGDFTLTQKAMTRALSADGKDMTDLWVLDYKDGVLAQTAIHQTSEDTDFGSPTVPLSLGNHHLYFIASRSQSPSLNTDAHTLSFAKVRDTFYKDVSLNVTSASTGSQTVMLDRVVTKLRVVINDAVPADAATFEITPAVWYYSMDYLTGEPVSATASQPIAITIPASSLGNTGEILSIFCLSGAGDFITDIAIACKALDESTLGQATISSAPMRQNRVTEYSGKLFSGQSGFGVSLLSAWDADYIATW